MIDTLTWFFGVGLATGTGWYLGQAVIDFVVGVMFPDDEDL